MSHLDSFSREERSKNPLHHIDPGFINRRKCFSAFGGPFAEAYKQFSRAGDDHMVRLANDHLIVNVVLGLCRAIGVKSLSEVLHQPEVGSLFCSTESLAGAGPVVYEENRRVENKVILPYDEREVVLEFGTEHFVASTGKLEQSDPHVISLVGQIREVTSDQIVLNPLIMGAPTLDHPENKNVGIPIATLAWYGWEWYETFPGDIDEFSGCESTTIADSAEWMKFMRSASESSVKNAVAEILGDSVKKDWGGEQADHFSASIHLAGERTTAAFLFKGPAGKKNFREMTPEMLGKRADQIYRLAATPARLLILQHCHHIGEAVRETLRRFAVAPHNPRRYCLVDGKDTYRILKAHGMASQ